MKRTPRVWKLDCLCRNPHHLANTISHLSWRRPQGPYRPGSRYRHHHTSGEAGLRHLRRAGGVRAGVDLWTHMGRTCVCSRSWPQGRSQTEDDSCQASACTGRYSRAWDRRRSFVRGAWDHTVNAVSARLSHWSASRTSRSLRSWWRLGAYEKLPTRHTCISTQSSSSVMSRRSVENAAAGASETVDPHSTHPAVCPWNWKACDGVQPPLGFLQGVTGIGNVDRAQNRAQL